MEKRRRKLYKNATSYIDQILEVKPHETAAVRPLTPISTTIQIIRTKHAGRCWRSKDELISNILRWTLSHRCASINRPTITFLQHFYTDTGWSLEDLSRAIDGRERERERERVKEIRANSAT